MAGAVANSRSITTGPGALMLPVEKEGDAALMLPEATPADATVSTSVRTVMPVVLPTVAAPNFSPLRVMTTAVLAAMLTTAVVMTMDVE